MAFTAEERKKYLQIGFEIDEQDVLIKYNGKETSVTIPDGVVTIGMRAFQDCKKICEVIIPSTVTKIEAQAFMDCSQLQSIVVPNSVKEIGSGVFVKCIRLESANLPERLTEISSQLFCNCNKLNSVVIPSTVTTIGQDAFFNCKSIKTLILPPHLMVIGNNAFTLCERLKDFGGDLHDLTEIGREAFACAKLQSFYLPVSLKKIGDDIFRECDKLKSVKYEGTAEQWNAIEKGVRNDYSQIIAFNVPYCNYKSLVCIDSASDTVSKTEAIKPTVVNTSNKQSSVHSPTSGTRYAVNNPQIQRDLDKLFAKLGELYPEYKIFAFDQLASHEREKLSKITKLLGLSSYQPILEGYGFEIITPEQTKQLRNKVIYTPGNEPNVIKNKVDNALKSLETYYPNKVIEKSVQNDHKSLASNLSGLYQWLGYEGLGAFLSAYGYQFNLAVRDSRKSYSTEIVEEIKRRYQCKTISTVKQLLDENADIASKIYGVSQASQTLFGMSWSDYLTSLGILVNVLSPKEIAFNEFMRIVRDTFPQGYQCTRISSLVDVCPALAPHLEQALEFCRKKRGMGLKEYLQRQGIMLSRPVPEKQIKPVIPEPNIEAYAKELGLSIGEIYIKGKDFYISDKKKRLDRYTGREKHVVVPYGIKEIGQGAFQWHIGIETVIIPGTVQKISQFAFKNCNNLKHVIIEEGLTTIGQYAFSFCDNLRDIRLPASYTEANPKSFNYGQVVTFAAGSQYHIEQGNIMEGTTLIRYLASHDEIITIPKYVERIGKAAFCWDTRLKGITIPEHVKEIGEEAFILCSSLTKVLCRAPITTLAQGMFVDCTSLLEVELPNTIERIQADAFANCEKLQKLNIPTALKQIDRNTFVNSKLEILPQNGKWILNECDLEDENTKHDWGEQFDCYAKVKFEGGKSYIYYSEYDVAIGDKVMVEGKRSGEVGTVVGFKEGYYDYDDVKEIVKIVECPITVDSVVVIKGAKRTTKQNDKNIDNNQFDEQTSQSDIDPTKVRWWFDVKFNLPSDELKKYNTGYEIDALALVLRRDLPDMYYASSLHEQVFSIIEAETDCKNGEEWQQELARRWEPTVREVLKHYRYAVVRDVYAKGLTATLFFEAVCERRVTKLVNGKIVESNFLSKFYNDNYDYVTYYYPSYLDEREMTIEYFDIYLLDDNSEQARKQNRLGGERQGTDSVWEEIDIDGIRFYSYIKHRDEGDYMYDLSHQTERISEKDGQTELCVKMTLEVNT